MTDPTTMTVEDMLASLPTDSPLLELATQDRLDPYVEHLIEQRRAADPPPYHDDANHAIKALPLRFRAVRPAVSA